MSVSTVTASITNTSIDSGKYTFVFEADPGKNFTIPADWFKLSGFLEDYIDAGPSSEIPLKDPPFTYAHAEIIDNVLDYIRITYKDLYNDCLASGKALDNFAFRNDSHCHAVRNALAADMRGALKMSDYLQIPLARKYFINYFANAIISLGQDTGKIIDVLGAEDSFTPEDIKAEGLSKTSVLWETFPKAYTAIYKGK